MLCYNSIIGVRRHLLQNVTQQYFFKKQIYITLFYKSLIIIIIMSLPLIIIGLNSLNIFMTSLKSTGVVLVEVSIKKVKCKKKIN